MPGLSGRRFPRRRPRPFAGQPRQCRSGCKVYAGAPRAAGQVGHGDAASQRPAPVLLRHRRGIDRVSGAARRPKLGSCKLAPRGHASRLTRPYGRDLFSCGSGSLWGIPYGRMSLRLAKLDATNTTSNAHSRTADWTSPRRGLAQAPCKGVRRGGVSCRRGTSARDATVPWCKTDRDRAFRHISQAKP